MDESSELTKEMTSPILEVSSYELEGNNISFVL